MGGASQRRVCKTLSLLHFIQSMRRMMRAHQTDYCQLQCGGGTATDWFGRPWKEIGASSRRTSAKRINEPSPQHHRCCGTPTTAQSANGGGGPPADYCAPSVSATYIESENGRV